MKGRIYETSTQIVLLMRLQESFFLQNDVVQVARQLLGKVLITNLEGQYTAARIVETEAYSWKERGCHAFGGKQTGRNAVMFKHGGHAYVYLCYGIHNLFNIVTNQKDCAEAVLIRAVEPLIGVAIMKKRRGAITKELQLTSGPGKLTKALGINRTHNCISLVGNEIWLETDDFHLTTNMIQHGPRIGIDYAGQDAKLPWRFWLKNNPWVSV